MLGWIEIRADLVIDRGFEAEIVVGAFCLGISHIDNQPLLVLFRLNGLYPVANVSAYFGLVELVVLISQAEYLSMCVSHLKSWLSYYLARHKIQIQIGGLSG